MLNNEEKFDPVKYRNSFNKEKYDRVNIMLPKGQKEVVKAYAGERGLSLNAFIIGLINKEMQK